MSKFSEGDAFVNKPAPNLPSHIWFIVSDPSQDAENVLIVNLTSDHFDQTCRVERHEHEWLTKDVCYANFTSSKITSVADLSRAESAGLLYRKARASRSLIDKLRNGAVDSPETPAQQRELLERQIYF